MLYKQNDSLFSYSKSYGGLQHYIYKVDARTGKSFAVFTTTHGCQIFSWNEAAQTIKHYSLVYTASASNFINLKQLSMDSSGGAYIWLFSRYGVNGNIIDKAGDYFMYFPDGGSAPTFKLFHRDSVVGGFSVEKDTSNVWYTDQVNLMVVKSDPNGNLLLSTSDPDFSRMLTGCCTSHEDGCWVVADYGAGNTTLFEINKYGTIDQRLEDFIGENRVTYMEMVEDAQAFWVLAGDSIYYIILEEEGLLRKLFSVEIPLANTMIVMENGCWVSSAEGKDYFIDKTAAKVTRTIAPTAKGYMRVPYFVTSRPDSGNVWDKEYPLTTDSYWNTLPFTKVNNEHFYLRNDTVYEAQITIRPNRPYTMYKEVSINEDWVPEDDFSGSLNDRPAEHRWNYYSDRVLIEDEQLVFTGHGFPGMSYGIRTDSFKKWYFYRGSGNNFNEFEVYYTVPDVSISGSVYIRFFMYPNNVNNDVNDQYYRANVTRTLSELTLQIQARGIRHYYSSSDRGYFSSTSSFPLSSIHGDGIITFSRFDNGRQLRLRHFDGVTWQEITCYTYRTDAPGYYNYWITFNDVYTLSAGIYVDSPRDVYITKFAVNEPLYRFYWYYTPPVIKSIHCQPFIRLNGITPEGFKNAYVKIDVPNTDDFNVDDEYKTNLLTWWRTAL